MSKLKLRNSIPKNTSSLFSELSTLIEKSRYKTAVIINAELTLLYWNIGFTIKKYILHNKRANYGDEIIATLSQQLTKRYGAGFTTSALTRMINFATVFPQKKIVATLSQQLSWSHFIELISLKDELSRSFYSQICVAERWSVRVLRERIDSLLYERTAISKKPGNLIKKELTALKKEKQWSPDLVFRDPYLLDYLNLRDTHSENDLESAIINELQRFITELGSDFAFVARQKRITIGGDDHYIDLLFYHRNLKRLVAVDLKLGKFKAAYKGQMELYLRWLNKHEKREGEHNPIGLILCGEKSEEYIELLELDKSNIRVAQYMTALPPKKLLQQRLHKAIEIAHKKLERATI